MLNLSPIVLAYIGPETIVPLTSVLAGAAGVLMMFWNTVRSGAVRVVQSIKRDKSP